MDQLLVDRPGWLDWAWALRVLDQEVRVTGEEVRPAEGLVATACLVAEEPLVVTVTGGGGHLAVTPPAPALVEFVTRRFHLDLDERAVDRVLERSTLARLFERDGWVRRPAAAMLWSFCLVFLCGGDPDAPSVRRMFAELGRPAGRLRLPPDPSDLLTAGDHRIVGYGVAPHRAANVIGLARAFAAEPDRYDEVTLRALPGDEAIARVAELPHIGPTRARAISSTALGHDDVLPDLARQDEELRSRLGLGWPQIRAAARHAVPYRSILGDTLLELLSD
jgi:3-methyladenine DNA glycosylase/8-oxoguanine DNA glycosylase